MDMTKGPLMGKLVRYAVPLLLTGVLQMLFNAADVIVVGNFAGNTALAAVGSTTSLTNLLVNVFMMISVGVSVVVARHYGAHEYDEVGETMSTAIIMSLGIGVAVGAFGIIMARRMLSAMDCPPDVLDQATLYMQIYFTGIPAFMVYNFGASALRAVGDTQRPLLFLTLAGVINVVLNLITVIAFKMGVAGVAIATSVSQYVSAALVLLSLVRSEGLLHLDLKRVRFGRDKFMAIIRVGLPAGMQSAMFSISNVMIQASINSFGSNVMAGNAAASNIEGFIYVAMQSVVQAAMAFTGQNMGARQYGRLNKILWSCILLELVAGGAGCGAAYLFSDGLISLYNSEPEVIIWGVERLRIICSMYYVMGVMDVIVGMMRGMGRSTLPMCISIFGICIFRIIWLYTVFAASPTFETLLMSYPVSWTITLIMHTICFIFVKRSVVSRGRKQNELTEGEA